MRGGKVEKWEFLYWDWEWPSEKVEEEEEEEMATDFYEVIYATVDSGQKR